jgi:hypothetical protein
MCEWVMKTSYRWMDQAALNYSLTADEAERVRKGQWPPESYLNAVEQWEKEAMGQAGKLSSGGKGKQNCIVQ